MIVNNPSEIINNKFFAVIIGSGPAGISTAIKLEKYKIKSLILEAGSLDYNPDSELFLKGKVVGDKHNDLTTSRVRKFGGTSNVWGGICNPMLENDFESWPIRKKDLNNYEKESREILNLRKNFFNEKFNENLNLYNLVWSNVKFGEKYYDHIKKSKFIFLSLNTTFLNFKSENKTIIFAECIKNNKKFKISSKNFVLSCGGIENSRLMLWSRNNNEKLFNPRMPIGKYYMNHPYHTIGEGLVESDNFFSFIKSANIINQPIITCNDGINISANKKFLQNNNILNSGIYIRFKTIDQKNNLIKQLRCVAPKYIKKLYEKIYIKDFYEIRISTLQEQGAYAENYINLSNERDPYNVPLTNIHWKKSIIEKKSVRLICEELADIFLRKEIGRLALKEYLYNNNLDYDVTAGNHQLGGTRMGFNDTESVVDKNLKVHNINNLYINGSSVFRTGGHCHPTYTIVKLSLRLADHLTNVKN